MECLRLSTLIVKSVVQRRQVSRCHEVALPGSADTKNEVVRKYPRDVPTRNKDDCRSRNCVDTECSVPHHDVSSLRKYW